MSSKQESAPRFNKFLVGSIIGSVLLLCVCLGSLCYPSISSWETLRRPRSLEDLIKLLSPAQLHCVEQVIGKDNLIHVELEGDKNFIGVGYVFSDRVYAAILDLTASTPCNVTFKAEIAWLEGHHKNGQPYFHKIQRVELTGDEEPEIYVWLDLYGVPRSGGTRHVFYSKQANGVYKQIFYGGIMCRGWSSVVFVESENIPRPKIILADDVRCDWVRSRLGTDYIEVLLNNDGYEIINHWHDEQ